LLRRGRIATRQVESEELAQQRIGGAVDLEALGLLFDRVEGESQVENDAQISNAFIRDASRQYVMNEYEVRYADPIAMYANILPPIGFVGTKIGLMVLFVSMHVANDSLHSSALALALSSSIFALIGYATLEGLRIHLYGRLQRCLDGESPETPALFTGSIHPPCSSQPQFCACCASPSHISNPGRRASALFRAKIEPPELPVPAHAVFLKDPPDPCTAGPSLDTVWVAGKCESPARDFAG
jgi:hypothetical protein